MKSNINKGILTISLDSEFAWGRINDPNLKKFIPLFKKTRNINNKLLSLFEKYQIH